MRVLQMHNHQASLGGAMEVLADEKELLSGAGHEVRQFTLPAADDLGLSAVQAGMKAVWNREASRQAGREIVAFRPDVVHVHTPFPLLSPAVFRTAAAHGVPSVTTLHSFRYSCVVGTCYREGSVCEDCVGSKLKLSGLRHRCYHESVAATGALTLGLVLHRTIGTFGHSVNRYLALTEFARRLLIRDGFPEERIRVKANFTPDPGHVIPARETDPYIAFAGRLVDVKGIHTLLDGWRLSQPRGLRLRIAGDGPLRPLVEQRVAEDPSVEYLGWISQGEVTRLMGEAVCVVLPSEWYEGGQPLATIRGMSSGTPIIVSDLENLREDVIDEGAGVAFRTGDPAALAEVLGTLVTEADAWTARRQSARASYLRRHTPDTTLRALETTYSEVIAEGADQSGVRPRVGPGVQARGRPGTRGPHSNVDRRPGPAR